METFSELVQNGTFNWGSASITDWPHFKHRGFMIGMYTCVGGAALIVTCAEVTLHSPTPLQTRGAGSSLWTLSRACWMA